MSADAFRMLAHHGNRSISYVSTSWTPSKPQQVHIVSSSPRPENFSQTDEMIFFFFLEVTVPDLLCGPLLRTALRFAVTARRTLARQM